MSINRFLEYIRYEKNFSTHTVLSYKNDLYQFNSFLGQHCKVVELQAVTEEEVREWASSLAEQKLSSRSVARKLSSVRAFYRYLLACSEIEANPAKNVSAPKASKGFPLYARQDSMDELLDDVSYGEDFIGVRNRLIIAMLYETGMRRAELIALKDIDVHARGLKVTGKRNKQRIIPFGEELERMIAEYRRVRQGCNLPDNDYFFLKEDGGALYPQLVYRLVKQKLSQVCTLDRRSPHVLRHTFASAMLNNGAGINSVKELLGHHSLASTEIYTHITIEELKQNYNQALPKRRP